MSTNDAVLVAKKFVQEVDKIIPIEKAYLFGSFAKKEDTEGSDIDVCLVSSKFSKDYFDEESKLRRLSLKIDFRISPVAFNSQDINDPYSQLAHEVLKYGIQLK